MKNKSVSIELDIKDLLDLTDKDSLEYDINYIIENGIDKYLEKQKEEQELKDEFVDKFCDSYVYEKVKNHLIRDGFIYQCKFCWGLDVSGQYAKRNKPNIL